MWDRLRRAGTREFLTVPLRVWAIVLVIWIIGLAISMPSVWFGLNENVDRIPLMVGSFGALFLGTVGFLGLYVNYRRTRTFEKQLEQQRLSINQQRESDKRRDHQQLYTTNVQHLGHSSENVRLGAIYGLERLAKESKDSDESWVSTVGRILCAHVRSTTTTNNYKESYADQPSSEVIAILEILTQRKNNPFNSAQFDLSGANLDGINLRGADLKGTNLTKASLRGADLRKTNLDGTNLSKTNLSGADLSGNDLRRVDLKNDTDLSRADLGSVDLSGAVLSGTDISKSQNIEAHILGIRVNRVNLSQSDLKGANLSETDLTQINLSDADLSGASLIGANLDWANLSRADLCHTNLEGANITGVDLTGAIRLTKDRSKMGSFSECKIESGFVVKLHNICWGIYTRDLAEIELGDLGTGNHENRDKHLAENTERREPTQKEKEYLVGKDNVYRCEWGDILVLEGDSVNERLI